jgi:uncharacterized protein involved in exopolysaccharide biosynthesis
LYRGIELKNVSNEPITTEHVGAAFRLRWKSIALVSLIFGGATFAFIHFSQPKFRGIATLLVVTPDLGAKANQLAVLSATASTPLRTIKGVMQSERELSAIRTKFNLDWRIFDTAFKVVDESQSNQLIISYESTDREKIVPVLEFSLSMLGDLDKELSFSAGSRQADTLRTAVADKKEELRAVEEKLLTFQKKMKAPSVPDKPETVGNYIEELRNLEFELAGVKQQLSTLRSQAKNAATAPSDIPTVIPNAKIWQKSVAEDEYELKVALTSLGPENPEVVSLTRKLEQSRVKFKEAVQSYYKSVNRSLDPKVAELEAKRTLLESQVITARGYANVAPQEALTLTRLVTEVLTVRTVYGQLRSQFEQAKIESEVGKVRWSVLDAPYIHPRPTNKARLIPSIASTLLGFFIALISSTKKYVKSQ